MSAAALAVVLAATVAAAIRSLWSP